MILNTIRDLETQLIVESPEMQMQVEQDKSMYTGKGNMCAIMGMVFADLHLSRDQRLTFIGYVFNIPTPKSMKGLTRAQLTALFRFRSAMRELWIYFASS